MEEVAPVFVGVSNFTDVAKAPFAFEKNAVFAVPRILKPTQRSSFPPFLYFWFFRLPIFAWKRLNSQLFPDNPFMVGMSAFSVGSGSVNVKSACHAAFTSLNHAWMQDFRHFQPHVRKPMMSNNQMTQRQNSANLPPGFPKRFSFHFDSVLFKFLD